MDQYIQEFKSIYSVQLMILVLGIGVFLFFVDYKKLKKREYLKDANLSRKLGIVYVVIGIGLYIVKKII